MDEADERPGAFVEVEVVDGRARVVATVAPARSALAALVRIAADHGLDAVFPPAVEHALLERARDGWPPGTDDAAVEGLEAIPFVTIDNEDSRSGMRSI